MDSWLLSWKHFGRIVEGPSFKLLVVVQPRQVVEVVDLVVALFVEDLELHGRQGVLGLHLVHDLNGGHVLAVQSVLDLQDVEIVLEVVENGF